MRKSVLLAAAVILASAPAFSAAKPTNQTVKPVETPALQKSKAPMLNLPDGSRVLFELNLSQDNLLDMVKQAIPSFFEGAKACGDLGEAIQKIDLNGLYASIEGIKSLRVTNFHAKAKTEQSTLLSYLEKQLPNSKGWERIYYDTTLVPNSVIAAYEQNDSYVFFKVDTKTNDNYVVGTTGFIDIPKLSKWVGNLISLKAKMFQDEMDDLSGENDPPSTSQPVTPKN